MADMVISNTQLQPVNNNVSQAQVNNRSNVKNIDTPDVVKEDSKALEVSDERREKLREELLENVISVSEDGDTVQVSDDGTDKLNNTVNQADIYEEEIPVNDTKTDSYYVEVSRLDNNDKDDSDNININNNSDNTSSSTLSNITSFKGYTDKQLEQMYLKGEISKYNYDQEMNARKAQREEMLDNNEDASKEVMATVNGMERVSQDAAQLQQAFAEGTASTPDAAQRVEIMSTLQDFTKLQ